MQNPDIETRNFADAAEKPALLAKALSLSANPEGASDDDELLAAASDLVAWGAFEEALSIVERFEERGVLTAEAAALRASVDRVQGSRRVMGDRSLVNAIKTVHDPAATWQSLLSAADNLLRWGALDDADAAIDRLRGHEKTKAAAAAMAATTRQLRRSGVLSAFSPVGYQETGNLNRPYEALVARGGAHADKAIVVFTGTDRKFWMSLQVLYHFLRKLGAHVIYLSDHSNTQFLNGLHSIGGGYQGLVARVNQLVEGLGVTRKFVMASSAGGFVGLRAAADLNSEAFLGMGIRTAMTADSGLPLGNYEKAAVNRCRDKDVLTNLRAYLASRKTPGRVLLYCGDGVKFDIAHAENLSGLPNVKVHMLPEYNEHNVMPGLIARGQFEGVLREFLAATEPNAPV